MAKRKRDPRVVSLAGARGFGADGKFFAPEIEQLDGALPVPRSLPRASDLLPGQLTPHEITRLLQSYGVMPGTTALRDSAAEYVARMTNKTGPAFWDEVDRVLNRDGLLQQARRVQQQYSTLLGVGGNEDQELVWVTDGGEGLCDPCAALAGEVSTYREWMRRGVMPGASVCQGGDRCRCELIPIG